MSMINKGNGLLGARMRKIILMPFWIGVKFKGGFSFMERWYCFYCIESWKIKVAVTIAVDFKNWYDTASRCRLRSSHFVVTWNFLFHKKFKNIKDPKYSKMVENIIFANSCDNNKKKKKLKYWSRQIITF